MAPLCEHVSSFYTQILTMLWLFQSPDEYFIMIIITATNTIALALMAMVTIALTYRNHLDIKMANSIT